MMQIQGTARIADFLGDFIIYRCLEPADPRLPGLRALAGEVGLEKGVLPRKTDEAYARVVAHILRAARSLDKPETPLRQLLYIGDSPQLDVRAFLNLLREGGWPGWAFIGADNLAEAPALTPDGQVCRGNRWSLLTDFLTWTQGQGGRLDASLAVVVDLDKTILGPRGRNDGSIDTARTCAAVRIARSVSGEGFGEDTFGRVYKEMHQAKYHFFTEDNQDYLVYCALMIAAGLYGFSALQEDFAAHRVSTFVDFLAIVERQIARTGSSGVRAIHREVMDNFCSGDPTPFKSFRREEYLTTTERMSTDGQGADLPALLKERITINYEVAQAIVYLRRQGVLALGLSDKPDEAVFPTEALLAQGHQPLHRTAALLVGESLGLE